MQGLENKTIKEIARECHSVDDILDLLKNLFRDTLQQVFEAELEEHLGYLKHDPAGSSIRNNISNNRLIRTRFGICFLLILTMFPVGLVIK